MDNIADEPRADNSMSDGALAMRNYRMRKRIERFQVAQWRHVEKTETCWNWTGHTAGAGYPVVRFKGYPAIRASRYFYQLIIGPIPDDRYLRPACGNRLCVNPEHYTSELDRTDEFEERLWAKVRRTETCWLWTGRKVSGGYGSTPMLNGRRQLAHRYFYERFVGPILEGYEVCHSCDNPPCVNPEHLWLGTSADNTFDMIAKGRAGWQKKRNK